MAASALHEALQAGCSPCRVEQDRRELAGRGERGEATGEARIGGCRWRRIDARHIPKDQGHFMVVVQVSDSRPFWCHIVCVRWAHRRSARQSPAARFLGVDTDVMCAGFAATLQEALVNQSIAFVA